MILLINGPFGVEKTSVARVLVERSPDTLLYDPEVIGSVLERVLGPFKKADDFQYYALWRKLVVAVAHGLRAGSARALVIPITIWRRDYFDSIDAGVSRVDPDLRCFRLTASENELLRRITSNSKDKGAYGWCMSHLEVGLGASCSPAFGAEIPTGGLTAAEIAGQILEGLGTPTG